METNPPRKNDVLASNILYIGLAVSFLLTVIDFLTTYQLPDSVAGLPNVRSRLFGMVLLIHLLEAALYYAIRLGKKWAKIVLLILMVLTIMPVLQGDEETLNTWSTNLWNLARQIVAFVTGVWALVLLFRKPRPQSV